MGEIQCYIWLQGSAVARGNTTADDGVNLNKDPDK